MNSHDTTTFPRRRKPAAFQLVVISLLAVCAAWGVSGTAQSTEQSAEKEEREVLDKIPKHLPIKVKFKNPEKAQDLANDSWLADMEIEVQNTGTKPIYYLSIFMRFVDVKRDSGTKFSYGFEYGRGKLIEVTDELATPEDVPIPPGGTHVFKLHKDYVDGWNWYRTQIEQKPQPKKIEFAFSTLSHGDGTGYVSNGGIFVPTRPRKKSSHERESKSDRVVTIASGCRPARPPNPTSQLVLSFLPAAFLPVNFSPARMGVATTGGDSLQNICCPGEPQCSKLKLIHEQNNCFCPVDNPANGNSVESTYDCNAEGYVCSRPEFEYTECGSGITYRTCTKISLDFLCAEEPPPPSTPSECAAIGWHWNYTNNSCNEEDSGCPQNCFPYQPEESGACDQAVDYCRYMYGCPSGMTDGGSGCCCGATPVLIDVAGNGFNLTDGNGGVFFDMGGDGRRELVSWTVADSDDAWLALDRNGNGAIDDGRELFGNFTPQPAAPEPNGFLALAEYDKAAQGGNSDGVIDSRDAVFARLRLWRDADHNGVTGAGELHPLSALDVARIHLDYRESKRVDEHGNRFKYRSKVDDAKGAKVGRWAWDVFLRTSP